VLVLSTALTVGLAMALTFLHPGAYVATSTYEVSPRPGLGGEAGSARQREVAETFAQIAMSSVSAEAVHRDVAPVANAPLVTIESQVRPGTAVLEVTARASYPWLAQQSAKAAGNVLLDYREGYIDAFRLVLLAEANTATPEPSGLIVNVALGLVAGLALGGGLRPAVGWLRGLGRPQPMVVALGVGILFLLMGIAIPIMGGGGQTRLGGPPELFGIPLGGVEPLMFAVGLVLLLVALVGVVHEVVAN
jgi:hypothetical protein